MKNKKSVLFIAQAAMIAALYVVLTLLANALGLANYAIQLRFSEALTILPFFTPAAIPGLFVGCLIANLLTGAMPLDIIFGSLATLIGALGTYALAKHFRKSGKNHTAKQELSKEKASCKNQTLAKWLSPLPPIIANTIVVPFVLSYVYHLPGSIPYFMLTVGLGEVLSCGVLGMILLNILKKYEKYVFPVA